MKIKRQRGAKLLEVSVFFVLFGILAWALLFKLRNIEQEAERLQVTLTVRHIRIGVQLAVGEKLMHGQEDRLPELTQQSPFDFLGKNPGESWSYDKRQRRMSYRPKLPEAFAGKEELNWRFEPVWQTNGRMNTLKLTEE